MRTEQGVTLMELLLASSIGVVILLAMAHVDVTRILVGQQATGVADIQADPAFAVTHLARSITKADRLNLISPSNVRIRIPPDTGTGLDNPANYNWVQYRLDSDPMSGTRNTLFYFKINPDGTCTQASRFANIESLTLRPDVSNVGANNILEIIIASTADPQTREAVTFTGQATMRAGATDLTTGLLPSGVGDAPASC